MWSIGEVKKRGWNQIKFYYWPAFLLLLVFGVASSLSSLGHVDLEDLAEIFAGGGIASAGEIVGGLVLSFLAIAGLVGILVRIFLINPMEVGVYRYFMESRQINASAGVGRLLYVFTSGSYMNVVKIMFLRDLFQFLWTLLLIVPGIVKYFEYRMIPYILAENPEAASKDVFALTKDMMRGSKFHLFLFDLSFIGWYLLGMLACCIGMFFVTPYLQAAEAEIYAKLRKEITGFPFNGFGGEEREEETVTAEQAEFAEAKENGEAE